MRKSKPKAKQLSGKRFSAATEDELPVPKRQKRKTSTPASDPNVELGTWVPNKQDWEPLVSRIDTVERGDGDQLMAYVVFNNGRKTKVSMEQIYQHCPRPMLKFFEEHLRFK